MRVLDRIKKECDVILRVADARNIKTLFPFKTGKKTIVVFNKIDLCSVGELEALHRKYRTAVFLSTRTGKGKGRLLYALITIAKREKRPIRVGVIGYPNVGKSSIINMLRGRRSARVSPIPGETKGVQWLRIRDDVLMYDTPGVIAGKKDEQELVSAFAIAPENLEYAEGTAVELIRDITRKYGMQKLCSFYKIECEEAESPENILEKIARRHGMFMKGGRLDVDRAAKKVIREWQQGKMK